MLITLEETIRSEELNAIQRLLESQGIGHCVSRRERQTLIGLEQNPSQELVVKLIQMRGIEQVIPTTTPYKMASSAYRKKKTQIQVGNITIGGEQVILMAGPCAIESLEQLNAIAKEMKEAGVTVLRGSAFKPRTSPYSFQGLGVEGLKIHKEVQKRYGLVIETEVMDVRDVEIVAEHVDIVRIGARNMQNFDLLKQVGKCGKPVILKRGMSATVEEWLMSAEYLMAHGNHQVILCERGIRTFETSTRSTLDLGSVAVVKGLSHLPVIVDPSHAAGRKDIIPALSKAAVALGADGLLIEVHHQPEGAKCDGKQALLPDELKALRKELERIAHSIGRSL